LFIMYMAGNTISIFPAMMVCMMGWRPLQALMSLSASEYSPHDIPGGPHRHHGPLGLHTDTHRCRAGGRRPPRPSDWLAFVTPPQRMEFTGGGLIL
ncbi:ER membrane protein complex subunit 4, partial [Manacus vitellinus]